MALLIGVAGGSGAGKPALLRALTPQLGTTAIIDLDSYYLDRSHLSADERDLINYDDPSAFDLPLLLDHLRHLAAGEGTSKPRYSFETHTRIGSEPVTPSRLILVEGLFTLWWDDLRAILDLKLFVDAPPDVRLVEPTKAHADHIVDNTAPGHQALHGAAAAVLQMLRAVTVGS